MDASVHNKLMSLGIFEVAKLCLGFVLFLFVVLGVAVCALGNWLFFSMETYGHPGANFLSLGPSGFSCRA